MAESYVTPITPHDVEDPEPPPAVDINKLTLRHIVRSGIKLPDDFGDSMDSFVVPTTKDLSLRNILFETRRIISAEKTHACSAVPLLRHRALYESAAEVPEKHTICDLVAQYDGLKDALMNVRRCTTIPLLPYVSIPIPPIALEYLRNP